MRWREFIVAIGLAAALFLAACSPDPTPDSIAQCMTANYPSYNPRDREQCIAACIKCKNGVTTTCATACSLQGSR